LLYAKRRGEINPTIIPSCHRKARQQTPTRYGANHLTQSSHNNDREKPDNKPSLTVAKIILPKASITMTNSNGDKGLPGLKPQEVLKKWV
jgi:hypothetical protein